MTVRRSAIISAMAAYTAALVATAAPAHADDDSYLAYLADHGVGTGVLSVPQKLRLGHGACTELHAGKTPDKVSGEVPQLSWAGIDGLGVAIAAQRELCPDTLH